MFWEREIWILDRVNLEVVEMNEGFNRRPEADENLP
jgi:hypothetical protein